MFDPNVPSYFLIILCGFGAVWSFRHFSKRHTEKIYEFEYVAFSTFWGSLIFWPVLLCLARYPNLLQYLSYYPFIATPSLFLLGMFLGWFAAFITKKIKN